MTKLEGPDRITRPEVPSWRGIVEFNKEGPAKDADEPPDVELEEQKDEE